MFSFGREFKKQKQKRSEEGVSKFKRNLFRFSSSGNVRDVTEVIKATYTCQEVRNFNSAKKRKDC